jgi:hypothetical protein
MRNNALPRITVNWGGSSDDLFVRPTEHAQKVWDTVTTFRVLDVVLGG